MRRKNLFHLLHFPMESDGSSRRQSGCTWYENLKEFVCHLLRLGWAYSWKKKSHAAFIGFYMTNKPSLQQDVVREPLRPLNRQFLVPLSHTSDQASLEAHSTRWLPWNQSHVRILDHDSEIDSLLPKNGIEAYVIEKRRPTRKGMVLFRYSLNYTAPLAQDVQFPHSTKSNGLVSHPPDVASHPTAKVFLPRSPDH